MLPEDKILNIQASIKYTFNNIENLHEALTHPSFAAEAKERIRDNQRLEFLGDTVIQVIITNRIYSHFHDLPEGELTKIRAALTRESTLADFARKINLGASLRLGHGERLNRGYERDSLLCDAFEALIGAIYIDCEKSLEMADNLINGLINESYTTDELRLLVRMGNPKGALQEWTQKHLNATPAYTVLETSGPDHEKTFKVAVYVDNQCFGIGEAGKRQTAEEHAARLAMEHLKKSGK